MIKTINFSDFTDGFSGSYKDNFSYDGKRALFDYLEQYEEDTGEKVEFDPIALCCEYTEYEDMAELKGVYPDIEDMEDLENHTTVIKIDGTDGFIIADF